MTKIWEPEPPTIQELECPVCFSTMDLIEYHKPANAWLAQCHSCGEPLEIEPINLEEQEGYGRDD